MRLGAVRSVNSGTNTCAITFLLSSVASCTEGIGRVIRCLLYAVVAQGRTRVWMMWCCHFGVADEPAVACGRVGNGHAGVRVVAPGIYFSLVQ